MVPTIHSFIHDISIHVGVDVDFRMAMVAISFMVVGASDVIVGKGSGLVFGDSDLVGKNV